MNFFGGQIADLIHWEKYCATRWFGYIVNIDSEYFRMLVKSFLSVVVNMTCTPSAASARQDIPNHRTFECLNLSVAAVRLRTN
jgi:hypothetical protein